MYPALLKIHSESWDRVIFFISAIVTRWWLDCNCYHSGLVWMCYSVSTMESSSPALLWDVSAVWRCILSTQEHGLPDCGASSGRLRPLNWESQGRVWHHQSHLVWRKASESKYVPVLPKQLCVITPMYIWDAHTISFLHDIIIIIIQLSACHARDTSEHVLRCHWPHP